MIEPIRTRSDIVLAKIQARSPSDKNKLIQALDYKVERVYEILFTIEKRVDDSGLVVLGKLIRDALEA